LFKIKLVLLLNVENKYIAKNNIDTAIIASVIINPFLCLLNFRNPFASPSVV